MIKTDDENGGKHGKCPSCKQRVYIPMADAEPLDFAPVDAAEEKAARKRDLQSKALADSLLAGGGEGGGKPGASTGTPAPRSSKPAPVPDVDVESLVIEFSICMFEGELEEAQQIKQQLRGHKAKIADTVQRIVADEIPPAALSHIPRPVLVGFLKQL